MKVRQSRGAALWHGLPRICLVLVLVLLGRPVLAQGADAREGLVPAQLDSDTGLYGGENIHPRNGSVQWETTDLVIPGNAGLDIVVNRSYNKAFSYFYPPAKHTFGYRWQLELPRIMASLPPESGQNFGQMSAGQICLQQDYFNYTMEFFNYFYDPMQPPDPAFNPITVLGHASSYGSEIILVIPGEPPRPLVRRLSTATQFSSAPTFVTTDNWQVSCSTSGDDQGWIVRSPRGQTFVLNNRAEYNLGDTQFGFSGSRFLFTATKVADLHGNSLAYSYVDNRLSQISSTDGRSVSFAYYPVGSPYEGFINTVTAGSAVWTYNYEQVTTSPSLFQGKRLSQVDLPEGINWQYTYVPQGTTGAGQLKTVRVPFGGTITYEYGTTREDFNVKREPNGFPDRYITFRRINDDAWKYTHALANDDLEEHATITSPSGACDKFVYQRGVDSYKEVEVLTDLGANRWRTGQLLSHQTHASSETPCTGTELRKEVFGYTALTNVGGHVLYKNPATLATMGPVAITSQSITDTPLSQVYLTTRSNYNSFGHPQNITESGVDYNGAVSLAKTITYFNNAAQGIIGLVDVETIPAEEVLEGVPSLGRGTVDRDYTTKGLLEKETRHGIVRNFTYYTDGSPEKELWTQNGTARQILYENYYRGKPRKETHPEGVVIDREINSTGTIAWEEDGENNRTSYEYDNLNRIKKITPAVGTVTDITYPTRNSIDETRGNYNKSTSLTGFGLPTQVMEADSSTPFLGSTTWKRTYYDAMGRPTRKTFKSFYFGDTHGLEYQYDELDRLTRITNTVDGTYVSRCYSNSCNPSGNYPSSLVNGYISTDERGYQTVHEFRSFGNPNEKALRKVSHQVRKGSESGGLKFIDTLITRDQFNKVTGISQGGKSRTLVYDARQLLWKVTDPETGLTTMTYDEIGNKKTSKVGSSADTTYTYDGRNRLTFINYPSTAPDVDFGYFKTDKVNYVATGTSISDGSPAGADTRWDYTYNARNELDTETLTVNGAPSTYMVDHDYDGLGNRSSTTYPGNNEVVAYQPDALGRIKKVGSYVTAVSYHADGEPSAITYGNGRKLNITRTLRQFPDGLGLTGAAGFPFPTDISLNYDYDDTGNTTAVTDYLDSSNSRTHGYDGMNRITSASGPWGSGSFTYDDVGNIKTLVVGATTWTYNYGSSNNRLESIAGNPPYSSLGYDAYGNTTNIGSRTFTYNTASQLTSMSSGSVNLMYDGNNRRARKQSGAGSPITIYSGYGQSGQLFFTRDTTNDLNTNYFYLGNKLVARRDFGAGAKRIDTDSDSIPNYLETIASLNPLDPNDAFADSDDDDLVGVSEVASKTGANDGDFDDDGMPDGYEVKNGLPPAQSNTATDWDTDGLLDPAEYLAGTNPNKKDSDGDGINDGQDAAPLTNAAAMITTVTAMLRTNVAPTSTGIPSLVYQAGAAVTLALGPYFSDADEDDLYFSATGLPAGLTLNQDTALLSGTLAAPDGGYSITITANDLNGGTASESFILTVASGGGCGGACHGE